MLRHWSMPTRTSIVEARRIRTNPITLRHGKVAGKIRTNTLLNMFSLTGLEVFGVMAIGQFFSQRFGYAVHAIAFIARKPAGELATLPELADWMRTIWPDASDSYLSNVVFGDGLGGTRVPVR